MKQCFRVKSGDCEVTNYGLQVKQPQTVEQQRNC